MRSVSLPGDIPFFTMTKIRLFWEPGVRSRSDNFSHTGMTQWGVFGARAAPKSMCTHQAHRLKKIDEKGDFFGQMLKCVPNVRKSFLGRADRKNLLIYPFPPQNIRILSIAPLEQILWLHENGSKNQLLGRFPLGFGCKIFKNFFAQNCIKTHFRYLVSTSESMGHVYAPIRHIGGVQKILPKMAIYPQMKKLMVVPGGCLYLGCGAGKINFHIIPLWCINIIG